MADSELAGIDPSHPAPTEPLPVPDLWVLAKQIDELGGEWTFPVFIQRAGNFHLSWQNPMFYEPTSSFDRLGLEALLQEKAAAYCPPQLRGDVGVSIKVYPSMFDPKDGTIPIPQDGEHSIGEHFMAVLGAKDNDTLVIRNSWSGWRSEVGGIGYLTRQYFDEYGTEGIVARPWGYGPDMDSAEALLRCDDQREFNRMWRRRRNYGSIDSIQNRPDVSLNWYRCWSLDLESPAELLIVRLGRRISVATAILVHRQDNSTSDLSDIFVWPSYRRQGYGLLLEGYAAERAKNAGSSNLGIYLWNSDAVKGRDRALSFMRAAKYPEIEEVSSSQFVAYGRRSILRPDRSTT